MTPRLRMVIAGWRHANDGDSWARINGAWIVLHALIKEAVRQDSKERS